MVASAVNRFTTEELWKEWTRSAVLGGLAGDHRYGKETAVLHRMATTPGIQEDQN